MQPMNSTFSSTKIGRRTVGIIVLAYWTTMFPTFGQTTIFRENQEILANAATTTQFGRENAHELFLHLTQAPFDQSKGNAAKPAKELKLVFDDQKGLQMRIILIRYANLEFACRRGLLPPTTQKTIASIGPTTFSFVAPDLLVCSNGKISANFDRSQTTGAVTVAGALVAKNSLVLSGAETHALYNMMERFGPIARQFQLHHGN